MPHGHIIEMPQSKSKMCSFIWREFYNYSNADFFRFSCEYHLYPQDKRAEIRLLDLREDLGVPDSRARA
jgi:hypothetical protein